MILASSGKWRVEQFVVTPEDAQFEQMRMFNPSSLGRGTPAGTYRRLMRGDQLVMSDTPDERRDHQSFVRRAHGAVLINGLGLGVCLSDVLRKPDVAHVRVIEIAPEVIELVGPDFAGDPRVEIINADAYDYTPAKGERFEVVWHDIWDDICADNLRGMKALHRKYSRRCDWQASWCREL